MSARGVSAYGNRCGVGLVWRVPLSYEWLVGPTTNQEKERACKDCNDHE